MKKLFFTVVCLFFFSGFSFSQTRVIIFGKQLTQKEQNAILECEGKKIQRTMIIDSVSCSCDGFWIMRGTKGNKPVKAFWRESIMPRAIGFELKPDTYFIYPNIKENSDSAFVEIWLRKK